MTPVPAVVALTLGALALFWYLLTGQEQQFDEQLTDGAAGFSSIPASPGMETFAEAIAFAEGYSDQFGRSLPANIPARAHNPGDLKIPGWKGSTLGTGISVFSSDAEGFARLYFQLNLILSGQSRVYKPTDTISQMAAKWTATDKGAWAANVAGFLGTSTDAQVGPLLGNSINGISS